MANRVRAIVLSAVDRQALERLQRSPKAPAGVTRRARAVLLMAQQVSGADIARQTGYTTVQVSRIRRRYSDAGMTGLADQPRSGRPPMVTARKTARIVALTLKPPPPGVTHWSSRDLAEQVGVSHTTVHRIWRAHALQPHRLETFKFSTDPEAEAKIFDVVGLYLQPPANAVVLSVDEKTQIQALSRTQPLLPLRPGLPARRTHDYRRNGLTSLYAAFNIASGRVLGACHARHTAVEFLDFLTVVHRQVPPTRPARHPRQFVDTFDPRDPRVAGRAPTGALPFHADGRVVAQSRRSLVQYLDAQIRTARILRHGTGAHHPHSALHRDLE